MATHPAPSLFLLRSSALHLSHVLFHLLLRSLLDDHLDASDFLFIGCFASCVVVAKAEEQFLPLGCSPLCQSFTG